MHIIFFENQYVSNLKPVAIYHRAECAKMLDDDRSEIKQYQLLFNNYPKHKLSIRSRYLAGQKLIKDRPQLAKNILRILFIMRPILIMPLLPNIISV